MTSLGKKVKTARENLRAALRAFNSTTADREYSVSPVDFEKFMSVGVELHANLEQLVVSPKAVEDNIVTLRQKPSSGQFDTNASADRKRKSLDLNTAAPCPKSMVLRADSKSDPTNVSSNETSRVWTRNAQQMNYDEIFGISHSQQPVVLRRKKKNPRPASVSDVGIVTSRVARPTGLDEITSQKENSDETTLRKGQRLKSRVLTQMIRPSRAKIDDFDRFDKTFRFNPNPANYLIEDFSPSEPSKKKDDALANVTLSDRPDHLRSSIVDLEPIVDTSNKLHAAPVIEIYDEFTQTLNASVLETRPPSIVPNAASNDWSDSDNVPLLPLR